MAGRKEGRKEEKIEPVGRFGYGRTYWYPAVAPTFFFSILLSLQLKSQYRLRDCIS